jgi:hypothetical protein
VREEKKKQDRILTGRGAESGSSSFVVAQVKNFFFLSVVICK